MISLRRCSWLLLVAGLFLSGCTNERVEVAATPAVQTSATTLPGRLLFARDGDLWLWQGDSASQFTQQGHLSQPAWSPDGTTIAAVLSGPSYSDVVLMPATGGEPRRLTDGDSPAPPNSFDRSRSTTWSRHPAFVPNGNQLIYVSQAGPPAGDPASDYNLTLFETDTAIGGETSQIYASDKGQVGKVASSASGQIVFAFTPSSTDPPVLLQYGDDDSTTIEGVPNESYDPAFTADGAVLAFASRIEGQTDIMALPAGGGNPVRLTTIGSARGPTFSPDGKWLAFFALTPGTSSFDLWIAPFSATNSGISAGEPKQLTNGLHLDPDSGIAWGQ